MPKKQHSIGIANNVLTDKERREVKSEVKYFNVTLPYGRCWTMALPACIKQKHIDFLCDLSQTQDFNGEFVPYLRSQFPNLSGMEAMKIVGLFVLLIDPYPETRTF